MKYLKIVFFSVAFFLINPQIIKAQLLITEVYPAPIDTESEWIEVFNSGEAALQLSDYKLFDQYSSPTLLHTFSNELLEPKQYRVVTLTTNKLNNAQDEVRLYDVQGTLVDTLAYNAAQSQMSFSKTLTANGVYSNEIISTQPTKNGPSTLPTPLPTATPKPSNIPTPTPIATATPVTEVTQPNTPSFNESSSVDQMSESIKFEEQLLLHQQVSELLTLPNLVVVEIASSSVRTVQRSYLTHPYVSEKGIFSAIIGGLLLVCAGLLT